MKQNIIEQMKEELYDSYHCQHDFKIDLDSLENYEEPFLWMVRKSGTSLSKIGASTMMGYITNESSRFRLFQDPLFHIIGITYNGYNVDGSKYFYYDGYELKRIKYDDIVPIFQNLCGAAVKMLTEYFADDFRIAKERIPLKFSSSVSACKYYDTLEYAQSINDDSLEQCIESLKKRIRVAKNQYVKISVDHCEHSFMFSVYINDNLDMVGGIIYDKDSEDNHWQIHT